MKHNQKMFLRKNITEHKSLIYSIIELFDGRIASCSDDSTIKIFNKKTFKCELTLTGHRRGVRCINQLNNSKLISGSGDSSIKIWSITDDSYTCEHTIEKAQNGLLNSLIPLTNNRMASSCTETSIKIWNSNYPYNLIIILDSQIKKATSLTQVKNKEILIAGEYLNERISVYNLYNYQKETVIEGVYCCFNNLYISNNILMIGGKNAIAIINLTNFKIEKICKNPIFRRVGSFISYEQDNILFGCDYGLLGLYNINSNYFGGVYQTPHEFLITSIIKIDNSTIITSSFDSTIKIFNYFLN